MNVPSLHSLRHKEGKRNLVLRKGYSFLIFEDHINLIRNYFARIVEREKFLLPNPNECNSSYTLSRNMLCRINIKQLSNHALVCDLLSFCHALKKLHTLFRK